MGNSRGGASNLQTATVIAATHRASAAKTMRIGQSCVAVDFGRAGQGLARASSAAALDRRKSPGFSSGPLMPSDGCCFGTFPPSEGVGFSARRLSGDRQHPPVPPLSLRGFPAGGGSFLARRPFFPLKVPSSLAWANRPGYREAPRIANCPQRPSFPERAPIIASLCLRSSRPRRG